MITLHFKCGYKAPRSDFRKVIGKKPLRCPECGAVGTKRTLKCKQCKKTYTIAFNGTKYSRMCESCRIIHAAKVKRDYQKKQRNSEAAIKKRLAERLERLSKQAARRAKREANIEASLHGMLQPERYIYCKDYETCLNKAAFANDVLNCENCQKYEEMSVFS